MREPWPQKMLVQVMSRVLMCEYMGMSMMVVVNHEQPEAVLESHLDSELRKHGVLERSRQNARISGHRWIVILKQHQAYTHNSI